MVLWCQSQTLKCGRYQPDLRGELGINTTTRVRLLCLRGRVGGPLITGAAVRSLATCRSVLGQDTEPQVAPNRLASPLHGSTNAICCQVFCLVPCSPLT